MPRRLTAALSQSGALPLLSGLGVQALTTYAFLVVAGRELGPVGFAALSGLYLLLTSTATGLFAPLEQEVTRRRGHDRAANAWDPTLFRRGILHGLIASTLATVIFLTAFPVTRKLLGDEPSLVVSLLVALPGYACWFATRGDLAGTQRLLRYGVQLALDGLLRLLAALVFLAVDAGLAAYGAAFALSPWLTLLLTATTRRAPPGATAVQGTRFGSRFALLVVSALAAQLLINAGPLVVNLLSTPSERATAGLYLAALVVIRVPVFLFSAIQPSFLRALAEHVGRRDRTAFTRLLGRLLVGLLGVVALACVTATLLGPPVISWLFDFDEQLSRITVLLLTVAVGLFLVATVLGQSLLALGRHPAVAAGWLLGLVGLVLGTAWPGDAVTRATTGLMAGALVATAALAVLVRRELTHWRRIPSTPGSPAAVRRLPSMSQDGREHRTHPRSQPAAPLFSIITAVYRPPLDAFRDTAASVLGQDYDDWEWVLVDDCSSDPAVHQELTELAARDPRIRVHEREQNGGIVAASSDALSRATGEFVCLLDHDDVLEPTALAVVASTLDKHPGVDYAYSDQDRKTIDGRNHSPFRKPDWSPERLRHHMYTTHFSVLRRTLALEVGGFRAGYDGSQDHDLVLRVTERAREVRHIPAVLYHWREVPGSAAGDAEAKPWAWDAGVRAVQSHLDRVGIAARASKGRAPGTYRVEREPDLTTPVSVVIPTIGSSGVVRGVPRTMVVETVRSVLEHSAHEDLEIVVVYDLPTPAEVLADLRALPWGERRLVLVPFRHPFNFSEKNNVGALHATGEVLVFLNDDMEAISDGVIEQLIAPLREPGVGATGPKLLFEGSRIQHAGLIYGSGTITHSYYRAAHPDVVGAYGELWVNREVTALTGACIAVRREVFEAVGGFAEELSVNYNDVDFCLKLHHTGHRLLWLHDVVLYHFESISRSNQVHPWEKAFIIDRWGDYLEVEERYSTNLR